MKKIYKLIFAATFLLGITSCNSVFYQVYNVDTDNLKQQDNSLVFENEDCKVLYNLWSRGGDVSFAFYNKTDKDIFVNLGQTFLSINGKAYDYYQDRTFTDARYSQYNTEFASATARLNGSGFWGNNIYQENASAVASATGSKSIKSFASSVTVKEKEIICIPAKCYKVICKCSINPERIATCKGNIDNPYDSYEVARYDKQSSPLKFLNRIAYGFNKNEVADKHIDNTFWITSIKNYSRKAATEMVKDDVDCYFRKSGFGTISKTRQFKIGGPDKFYIMYSTN